MQPIQFPFDLILPTQTNDDNCQIDHDTATYISNSFQTRSACVPCSSISLLCKMFLKPGHFSPFACSKFPRAWKKSVIVPHLKDGDHEVPNNNWPISLLPVFSKVAEKIALIQFNDFLTKQDKLTQHQSGNCKNHSTETLSLLVTDHILRAIDQQQLTAMVLIDLSKAFDSICHNTLLLKLRSLGSSSQALKWFESYLVRDRKQSTPLGTSLSDELTITHDMPQGSILGIMLFNLYINDLPSAVKSSCTDSYVDNTKIYRSFSAKNMNSCLVKMTEDLRLIAGWCCSHQLLINPSKTKLIFFGTRQLLGKVLDIRVPFLDQELSLVSSVKDLGITLGSYLNLNDHVNTLASPLLSMLCQISRVRHLFTKPVLSTILNSLIFSKLFYCSTVWAGTSKQNLQKLKVQNFAARVLTDTKKIDHISSVLRKLGWPSIKDQLLVRDTIQVYKIVTGLAPLYLSSKLSERLDTHHYNMRKSDNLSLPPCRTVTAQRSFYYRAVIAWNFLTRKH